MRYRLIQKRLLFLAALLCFLLAGCGGAAAGEETVTVTTAAAAGEETVTVTTAAAAAAGEETVTVTTAAASALPLPEGHGTPFGLAVCGDSLLVVDAAEDRVGITAFDAAGTLLYEAALDWEAENALYGVGGTGDGFALLFWAGEGFQIARYDASGNALGIVTLEGLTSGVLGPVQTADGAYVVWNPMELFVFDEAGTRRCGGELSGGMELITVAASGGECLAVVRNFMETGVCPVDLETGELGEFTALDTGTAYYTSSTGLENGVLVNAGDALYAYDAFGGVEKLFDWQDAGIDGTAVYCAAALGENRYVCMTEEAVSLITTEKRQVARTFLTVGAIGERNSRLESLVSAFNRSNESYYAETKYYDDSLQLTTELLAGNGPDVLEVTAVTVPRTGAYFEDLGPYLDSDPEISRSDLVESLLDAMTVGGKLTAIPSAFYLATVVGRTADVGPDSGWTMEDLLRILEEKGEGYSAFPAWVTAEALFGWVCDVSEGEFVDWDAFTCDFESESFLALLELCKMMPGEVDGASYAPGSDWDEHILLTIEYIQNPRVLGSTKEHYGGDEITYIGYPNGCGNNGSFFSKDRADLMLAVSAQSEHKDAAWLLVRELFSDECQGNTMGMPIVRSKLCAAIEPYVTASDAVLTQADMDKFLKLVDETELFVYYNTINDELIGKIMKAEAAPYFAGEKTAGEVAALIQNRVQLYLDEQKP